MSIGANELYNKMILEICRNLDVKQVLIYAK